MATIKKDFESMEKYKCIRTFELPMYDENELPTDDYHAVEKGTIWEYSHDYTSESDARLYLKDGNCDFSYIDITYERMADSFMRIF